MVQLPKPSGVQYTFKTGVNKCSQNPSQLSDRNEKTITSSTQQFPGQSKDLGHQNKKSTTRVKNLTEFNKRHLQALAQGSRVAGDPPLMEDGSMAMYSHRGKNNTYAPFFLRTEFYSLIPIWILTLCKL